MNAIKEFRKEYDFLGNSYPCCIIQDEEIFPSLEHAFQAAKTDDPILKIKIKNAPSAREAKLIGRSVTLIPDWDLKRLDVMASLVKQKFTENLDLKIRLLLTGDRELINTLKDTFWGQDKFGVGENHLGKILMNNRTQIRNLEGGAFKVLTNFLQEKKLGEMTIKLENLFSLAKDLQDSDLEIIEQLSIKEIVTSLK